MLKFNAVHIIPSLEDIKSKLGSKLNLYADELDTYFNKSKKPEIRLLDSHTFTVMFDIKNRDPKILETEGIYFLL